MRRTVTTTLVATLTAVAAVASVAVATPAAAHEEGEPHWHPVADQPPFELEACGTTVTVAEEVNDARELVTETEDGLRIRVKGTLILSMTTEDGRRAVLDASGPADIRVRERSVDLVLRGMSVLFAGDERAREEHERVGLPTIALVKGRVRIHDELDEDGELVSTEYLDLPRPGRRIVDACTLLEDADT